MIKLESTRKEFSVHDESGYHFQVVCVHDPECGWSASVLVGSSGMATDEAALAHLVPALDRLLGLLR
jgi:hypothetical protein